MGSTERAAARSPPPQGGRPPSALENLRADRTLIAAALDSLYRELTSVPPPTQWDNSFDATAQRMSWQKAERLAAQLFSLFLAVVELRRQA